jgi:hypothetical protein
MLASVLHVAAEDDVQSSSNRCALSAALPSFLVGIPFLYFPSQCCQVQIRGQGNLSVVQGMHDSGIWAEVGLFTFLTFWLLIGRHGRAPADSNIKISARSGSVCFCDGKGCGEWGSLSFVLGGRGGVGRVGG